MHSQCDIHKIRRRGRGSHYYRKVWQIACNTPPEKLQRVLGRVYAPPTVWHVDETQLFFRFPWNCLNIHKTIKQYKHKIKKTHIAVICTARWITSTCRKFYTNLPICRLVFQQFANCATHRWNSTLFPIAKVSGQIVNLHQTIHRYK